MSRTWMALAGLLLWAAAAPAQVERIPSIPPEGLVLSGPKILMPARITGGWRILPTRLTSARLPSMEQLLDKPPPNVFRLERQRRHERDKELSQRQGGTLLRGALTEFLYKRQRKRAERRR